MLTTPMAVTVLAPVEERHPDRNQPHGWRSWWTRLQFEMNNQGKRR